ncbi:hypothetical protein ABT168_19030, partial [Streptomyces sp. NPDC001793]|uniref:hypothetical protein n=1 Tax=Streptomyces sp. NPDC001793 TaxID=3154657 RepID=UPI00332C785E
GAAGAGRGPAAGLADAGAARPAVVAAAPGARAAAADTAAVRTEAAPAATMKLRHLGSHHVTHQTSFTSQAKPKKKMGFFKKLGIFLIVIIVVIIAIVILVIWLIVHFIRKAFRRRG